MAKTYGAKSIGTKPAGNKAATYSQTANIASALLEEDAVGASLLLN
jgi:hypothetical protein